MYTATLRLRPLHEVCLCILVVCVETQIKKKGRKREKESKIQNGDIA